MPYQSTLMENFNKSNPFVILSKREYATIMDDIQSMTKMGLSYFLILGILFVLKIGATVASIMLHTNDVLIGVIRCIILIAIAICQWLYFYNTLNRYQNKNPQLIQFERISNSALNDVVNMSSEDVLKSLHGLYQVRGQLERESYYMKKLFQGLVWIFSLQLAYELIIILRGVISR